MIIRDPGVLVSDWDGKELEETLGGLRSNFGSDCGDLERSGSCDGQSRSFYGASTVSDRSTSLAD